MQIGQKTLRYQTTVFPRPTPRPDAPIALYRGAHREGRLQMSWTPLEFVSRVYAEHSDRGGADIRYVYRHVAQPEELLGLIRSRENGSEYEEFIVSIDALNDDNVEELYSVYQAKTSLTRAQADWAEWRIKEGLKRFQLPQVQ